MRTTKTNLNLYRSFLEVYETRNYSVAASNSGHTQPTVSYNIRELEKSLGVKLFNTNSRGVEPTQHAEELYPTIKKAFINVEFAENNILEFNEKSEGVVRLNLSRYYTPFITSKTIVEFSKKHPNIKFVLNEDYIENGIDAIERRETDLLLFVYTDIKNYIKKDLTFFDIVDVKNSFFASHDFMQRYGIGKKITKEQLLNLPFLSFPKIAQARKGLENVGISKEPLLETNSTEMLIDLAQQGMGIVLAPDEYTDDGLIKIDVEDVEIPICRVAIMHETEMSNKAAVAFLNHLKKAFGVIK